MIASLKRILYFAVASYFRFFAHIRLNRWQPRVIAVTGSSGKTTLLHLLEAQLGNRARYSHHANSAIGIPFDILGLKRKTLLFYEWPLLFLLAPIKAFTAPPREKIYIAETDCDRPGEGAFLGSLLCPEVCLWLNATRTHSMNFDRLVEKKDFPTIESAVAREFSYLARHTSGLVVANNDLPQMSKELRQIKVPLALLEKKKLLNSYAPGLTRTGFTVRRMPYALPALAVEDVWYAVAATVCTLDYLSLPLDPAFSKFYPPPGRSSVFRGIRGVKIIDSSYNANLSSMTNVISMFDHLPVRKKWLVISDMLEQGALEKEEHEKLARILLGIKAERFILVGPRTGRYVYPLMKKALKERAPLQHFPAPREALAYLQQEITGRETVLFKGGRFLEGIIGHLLENPQDRQRLCRREKIWDIRRKHWGL
jgi:UDP-N-acetylmuramyl pentapeptide synthase